MENSIKDNNGWIKVSGRNNMPKRDCMIKVCFDGIPHPAVYDWDAKSSLMSVVNGYYMAAENYKYRFYAANTTHYKIVELDLKPNN